MALWTNVNEEAGKPKYLNSADKANTEALDKTGVAANPGSMQGWVLETDLGNGRIRRETLVALGEVKQP